MALVKTKPTSAGRRHLVKVVNAELHKGKPHAARAREKKQKPVVVTTTVASLPVISVVVTSSITV